MKKTNKNYQRLSIFFLVILGMFIVSCKNPLNLKHNSKDAKKAYIRISTNLSDSKVRSALPESFYDSKENDTKPGLIWELSGEESKGSEYEKIWEDDSTTNNTAYKQMLGDTSIELDVGTWTFTLTAYVKNSDGIQEKVLESTIEKTIVSGQNSLLFEMEEAVGDEGVANGEIKFTLSFPQNQIDNLAITLYNYPAQNGKYIPLGNQANQEISDEVSSYTYEYSNIEPGNYLLEIALQQETGLDLENNLPSYTTINTYTCVIHVAPGLKSVGSFNLSNLAKLYQISYKYIDGETEVEAQFDGSVTTSYNKYQTFTLPTPPTRTGYEFVGWYTSQECSGEPITEYNIPDDFAAEKIVFYAKWEEIGQPVELKYFYQDENKQSTENPSSVNIETTTSYTKLSVSSLDDSHSPWAYFAQTSEEITFGENKNYKVSVALKAKETTVIAIAAARADMYFTVGTEWETYEFETGNLASELKKEITFGVGASEETYIKNLKIEECEESTLPTLSFNVTMPAIKTYLQSYSEENECIIDVSTTKNQNNDINGYCIKINTPLSHFDESSNSVVQDVTLELRGYAKTKGLNAASFYMTSTDTELKTSLVGSTTSSSNYVTRWNKASDITTELKTVYFPAYEDNEEYAIDGVFSGGTKESTEVTITDFEVVNVTDLTNRGKVFAIKTIDDWQKYTGLPATSQTVTIENNNSIVFDVLLVDDFNEYPGENNGDHWDDCTRFLYSTTNCNIGDTGLSYSKGSENGNDTFNIQNNTGSSKDIAITLKDDFTVLIEEVTGTNNEQPAGGEMGLLFAKEEGQTEGYLLIYNQTGLENYRKIVNGETVQVPAKEGTWNQPVSYQLPAYLEDDIEIDGEWIPIGNCLDNRLQRDFDGQGHSITFTESSSFTGDCVGVFGYAGKYNEPNTISNLVVKGTLTSSSSTVNYVGGIVAYGVGINIENCINMASLCSGEYVGGIIGYVCNATENNVSKCINARPINSSRYVGGIVAYTLGDMEISDCMNLKDLQSAGTGFGTGIVYVGGNSSPTVNVKNCLNVGYVNLYEKYAISAYACSVTESYYDSSKWIRDNLQGGTFTQTPEDEDTAIAKTTEDLTNGNKLTGFSEDNWSFAEGRYPLPNILKNGNNEGISSEVWDEIVGAATVDVSGGNGDEIVQNAYYVSARGSDENVGSYTEPFKTLSKAITEASTSEHRTIYVIGELNGSSEGFSNSTTGNDEKNSVFYISKSVTSADNPITICGYPDTKATLSAEDVNQEDSSSPARVFASAGNYFVMENLIITGGNTQGSGGAILYYGGKLTLKNCIIEGNESLNSANSNSGIIYDGVYMYGTSELEMLDTECNNSIYLYDSSATFSGGILGYNDVANALPIVHVENATVTLKKDVAVFNTIYVKGTTANICVAESLTEHSSTGSATISLKLNDYTITNQLIFASEGVTLAEETQKFSLVDNSYIINTNGYVEKKN